MLSFKRLKQSKAARNTAAAYFAFFSMAASGFLSIPVAVRFLDKEEIGLWAAINAMISYLLWMDLGIGNAIGRKMADAIVAKDQEEIDNWWTLTQVTLWILGAGMVIIGLLCTPVFIAIFKVPPQLKSDAWLLLGVTSAIAGINFPLRAVPGLLTAQERFHWVSICQGTMPWLQFGGFYFMVSRGHGLSSYLWGTAASQFFVFVFYKVLVLHSEQRPRWSRAGFDRERFRSLFSFSLSMSVAGLKESLLQSLPTMILARHGGLASVPIYTFTARAPQIVASLVRRTSNAFYPSLINLYVAREKEEFLAKHRFTGMLTLTIATIAASGVLLFNQFFVELIAGRDYYAGPYANIGFAVSIIIVSMSTLHSCLLHVSGKMKKTSMVSILSLIGSYVAAILALQYFGMAGLAAVFAIEPMIYGIYGFTQGAKTMEYKISEFSLSTLIYACLSCLLMAASGIAMNFVPSGTLVIHLWSRSATVPGPYQFAIAILIAMIASAIGIQSMRKPNKTK
jgi:O-antigen/teichoic acid export membrane protein